MNREQYLVLINTLLLFGNLILFGMLLGLQNRVRHLEKWRASKRKRKPKKRLE